MNPITIEAEMMTVQQNMEPKKRSKVEAPECTICAEKFNKSNRSPIVCASCEFTACMTCSQTYILSESVPHCMNVDCGKEWTRHFMSRQFTKTFMKTKWRDHVTNQLFDHEKSMLPRAQITLEMMSRKAVETEEISQLADEISAMQRQLRIKQFDLAALSNQVKRRLEGNILEGNDDASDEKSERRKFTRNCPAADCRGYLSQQWKCGICEKWSCPECHEVIGQNRDSPHECKEDNIESAKEVMKSTKPCPKCATPIFRIEGCPQMWCTMCHSGFNWNTGKAYSSNAGIHNPHYFEYMRNQGTPNITAVAHGCIGWNAMTDNVLRYLRVKGGMVNNGNVLRNREFINGNRNNGQMSIVVSRSYEFISCVVRGINHVEHIDLNKFNTQHLNNEVTRCEYLKNNLDDGEFKRRIGANIQKKQKNDEYSQLFRMFVDMTKDITRRYVSKYLETIDINSYDNILQAYDNEMRELIRYCNMQSTDISETFDAGVYYELNITPIQYDTPSGEGIMNLSSKKRVKISRRKVEMGQEQEDEETN